MELSRDDADLFVGGSPNASSPIGGFGSSPTSPSILSFDSFEALGDMEDEETEAIRRFVSHKIESGIDGALSTLTSSQEWIRIVAETIKGVQRHAYL